MEHGCDFSGNHPSTFVPVIQHLELFLSPHSPVLICPGG